MTADAQQDQFEQTPSGWAKRWKVELDAAKEALKKYHEQGVKVNEEFLDERKDATQAFQTKWNLYSSNQQTLRALLYGNVPKVSVSRRFADAKDDAARVAGEMLERLLNSDIERSDDNYSTALDYVLMDRLGPGGGCARVRYVADFKTVPGKPPVLHEETGEELAEAVPDTEAKEYEDVETDYIHWRDLLWSPARVWHEVTWLAFAAEMTKEALVARFGEEVGNKVPLATKTQQERHADQKDTKDPWARARVWEIWHKETKKVFWYVDGYPEILEEKDDPLGLDGFWPCARPLFANLTTDKLIPRSDYVLSQDLYLEINAISTRIDRLQKAIKVVGVYDKTSPEVRRVLQETFDNDLVPVENWGAFAERGGLKGVMDFLPLDMLVNALNALRDYRRELVDALYQVSGMSDIMRGAASGRSVTATEQGIKARFGSVRVQALQDEFARFASDMQRLKAEVIAKHFDPQTIIERSNAQFAFDPQVTQAAVQLIKEQHSCYRIEVKPEVVSLTDFAQLKQERTEVIGALSTFMTSAAPLVQAMPGSMPFLLELLQATLAGLRGSSTMEGILDSAIEKIKADQAQAAAQPQQPPPPDPKVQAQQMKMQGDQMKAQADMQKEQFKHQADMERIQAETNAHAQQEQAQAEWNTREAMQKALVTRSLKPQEPSGGYKPGGGGFP